MGPYDSTLQMFVQTPQPVDVGRLSFLRWLAERGKLEHGVAGPPSGPLAGIVEAGLPGTPGSSAEGGSTIVASAIRRRIFDGASNWNASTEGNLPDGQTQSIVEGAQSIGGRGKEMFGR